MSKKQETQEETGALTPVRFSGAVATPAPSFMDDYGRMGTEEAAKKVRPPFLKIVQKQSDDALIHEFGIGTAILVPDRLPVLRDGDAPLRIVTLLQYTEYLKISPIGNKGKEPFIKERSLDPKSDLARRCMDPTLWSEPHPSFPNDPKNTYRNCEAINFLCFFQDEHMQGLETPFTLSFSRGSYGKGANFCRLLAMRKRPIFGCVFDLSIDPTPGQNAQGTWRRFQIDNPQGDPWVSNPDEFNIYKDLHIEAMSKLKEGMLETGYDDDTHDDGTSVGAGASASGTGEY